MSTNERIDHAAKAVQAIAESGDGRNPVTAAGSNAVTHAVLALVEQQRIANLIALFQGDSVIVPDHLFESVGNDIAAALGIQDGADR